MSDQKSEFDLEQFQRDLWKARVQAPEPVFEALLVDHHQSMRAAIEPLMEKSLPALEEMLGVGLLNARSDWYIEPAKKTMAAISKLSKGFAMAASDIAGFFPDAYTGADIRAVLTNPDQGEEFYPTRILFSASHFLAGISRYLPDEFWEQTEELQIRKMALEFVGSFPYDAIAAETTNLGVIFEAQTFTRMMPMVSSALKEKGHKNLSVIADCFAIKSQAISNDIITRVETAIAGSGKLDFRMPASMQRKPA